MNSHDYLMNVQALERIAQRNDRALQACGIPPFVQYSETLPTDYQLEIVNALKAHTSLANRTYDHLRNDAAALTRIEKMVMDEALKNAARQPKQRMLKLRNKAGIEYFEWIGGGFNDWAGEFKGKPLRQIGGFSSGK